MKIHVLGSSNLGQFVAHALRSTSNEVTIHFHRLRQADAFNALYGITVKTPSGDSLFRDGFGYEMKDERMLRAVPYIPHILEAQRRKEYVPAIATPKIRPLPEEASQPPQLEGSLGRKDSDIEILIVAKKGGEVYPALSQVKHRLKRNSTIVVLHNGMGVLSQVQNFWPEYLRPNILEGYSSHGISKVGEFTVDHWGQGLVHLAIAPRLDETDIFSYQSIQNSSLPPVINSRHVNSDLRLESLARADKYRSLVFIIRQLLSNQSLNCTLRAYLPDFYLIQLRRTVLHSILQTLGALQRCTNAELIENRINKRLIGKLLSEIISVLEHDPIVASSESYLKRFSFRSLYAQLLHIVQSTPNLTNSIQQDIAGKRELDLNYHSGHLLKLARQRGLKMPTWRIMHELVKSGAVLQQTRYNDFVPMTAEGEVKDLPDWMKDEPGIFRRSLRSEDNVVKERYGFEELEEEGIDDMESMELDDSWVGEYLKKSSRPIRSPSKDQSLKTTSGEETSRHDEPSAPNPSTDNPQTPHPNSDTQPEAPGNHHLFDTLTSNLNAVNKPTVGPSLLQRLQQTSHISDGLNRERLLLSIPNLRIKPKSQVVDRSAQTAGGKKEEKSMNPRSSQNAEGVPAKVGEDVSGSDAPEIGDTEMTQYILSTLNASGNSITDQMPASAEDDDVDSRDSESPNATTNPILQKNVITNKVSDTDVLLRSMRIRYNPRTETDHAISTGHPINHKERATSETEMPTTAAAVPPPAHFTNVSIEEEGEPMKKRRGRPPGSKNRLSKGKE